MIISQEYPLVSVGVVTYNSSSYVIETLESIKNQTYPSLELIISDDCSTDDTLSLCEEWLLQNKTRFVYSQIIKVDSNTGTSGNCNRAISACRGEYIKLIAGDDILLKSCIEENMKGIGDAALAISDLERFFGNTIYNSKNPIKFDKFIELSSYQRTKIYARTMFFCNVPSLFYARHLFETVGLYDESIPLLEDVPFLIKVFKSDVKIQYIPKVLVRYRQNGISNNQDFTKAIKFKKILINSYYKYCRPELKVYLLGDLISIIYYGIYKIILGFDSPILCRAYQSSFNILRKLLYLNTIC